MSRWLQKSRLGESVLARFRTSLPVKDELDINVCLESFKTHWEQAWTRIQSHKGGSSPVTMDDVNAVLNHTDQLLGLVCWELEQQQQQRQGEPPGRLAHLLLFFRVPGRLLSWSACCGQFEPLLQLELLRVFEQLLRAGGGALLEQRAVLRPLTDLLLRCRSPPELHRRLVQVLAQLCRALHARPSLLELFLGLEPDGSASSFVIFSLLVEFVHGEGVVGGTAREALLFCTRLSADSQLLTEFIVQHSDFCEVLATGLSGLYSVLPRATPADNEHLPEVDTFVCSLQFCNAVLQTCHPMIAAVLLELVYQGFLVSVMGPALHQSSTEAVVSATCYLELCLRSVDHPGLVRAIVRLLLRHRHDGVPIIDTLVHRVAAAPQLAAASLALLLALLNLNSEDVLLELVLRHLLPCSHLMASQRGRITEADLYGAGARRLLSLVPACCQPPAAADGAAWLQCCREARHALSACRRATRHWTYAYDGEQPTPAEAERMARRRRGSGTSVADRGADQRGEADGQSGREPAPAAEDRVLAGACSGSPMVDGWRLGHLQRTADGTVSPQPSDGDGLGPPPSDGDGLGPPPSDGDSLGPPPSNGDGLGPPPSDGDGLGPPPSDGDGLGPPPSDGDGLGPPPSDGDGLGPPPSDGDGLGPPPSDGLAPPGAGDLSVGDVWSTPQVSPGPPGRHTDHIEPRVGEPELDTDSLRLGPLSLLPDDSDSDSGDTWSFRSADVSAREEAVRRDSGVTEVVSSTPSEEAAVAQGTGGGPAADGSCSDGDPAEAAVSPATIGACCPSGSDDAQQPTPAAEPAPLPAEQTAPAQAQRDAVALVRGTAESVPTESVPGSVLSEWESFLADLDRESVPVGSEAESVPAESEAESVPAESEGESVPAESGREAGRPSSDLSPLVKRPSGPARPPPPSVLQHPLVGRLNLATESSADTPSLGPFLSVLLERLEVATTNSVQLNLLLMSVISRLSHYPQPLLRSLLLHPTLVLQPSVRSLIQTLGSLKHRIDLATRSVQDTPGLVRWARARLEARTAAVDSTAGTQPAQTGPATQDVPPPADGGSGGFRLSGLAGRLRRALPTVTVTSESSDPPPRRPPDSVGTPVEAGEWDPSERRLALTAVLLEHWLTELAAIALEHGVATDPPLFSLCQGERCGTLCGQIQQSPASDTAVSAV